MKGGAPDATQAGQSDSSDGKADAIRLMKKKLTKMWVDVKKKERDLEAKLIAQNRKEMQDAVDRNRRGRSRSQSPESPRRGRNPEHRSPRRGRSPSPRYGDGKTTPAKRAEAASGASERSRPRSPSPVVRTVTINSEKATTARYYNDYMYEFPEPMKGVRGIYLTRYEVHRERARIQLGQLRIRFEHNGSWCDAIIPPGVWDEADFLNEIERQMGSGVYSASRDMRTNCIFIKRLDHRTFRIDTNSDILTKLGFENIGETDATDSIMASRPTNIFKTDWYLYVEDKNMGILDYATPSKPIEFNAPETLYGLKIQIKDSEGKLVEVGNSPHVLTFEIE
jgi:hypothetical protein